MQQIIIGTIVITTGVLLSVFREKFVDYIVKLNNKGLGFFQYGKNEKDVGAWMARAFSFIFIVLGIAIFLGIFKLK